MPDRPGSIQSSRRRSGTLSRKPHLRLVAALDRVDLIALGLEVVAEHQGQRLLVLDDHHPGGHSGVTPCVNSTAVMLDVSLFGRSSVSGTPVIR